MTTETPADPAAPRSQPTRPKGAGNARKAGLLLHPTSLPGPFGIGDVGPSCERFLAWAASAGQRCWQMLPLSPTGPGDSPYSARSSFAGSPLLLSPERLVEQGLLAGDDLPYEGESGARRVDYRGAWLRKQPLLRRSFERFRNAPPAAERRAFERFADGEGDRRERDEIESWCLFDTLHRKLGDRSWVDWPPELRDREPAPLARARRELAEEIAFERYLQFLFRRQWEAVRRAARRRRIELVGDLPIYVAHDSADVWAHRTLFDLDPTGRPLTVAGVPPDYFSESGQLWGNPLYRWDRMAADGYAWWTARLAAALRWTDRVRLDHFRGFQAYWRVPANAATAAEGAWVEGPGRAFFEGLAAGLGVATAALPLLAEDLGQLSPEVHALRDSLGLPGMKVLQFAFGEDDSEHLPRHHRRSDVVYTGTHDNPTTHGWFRAAGTDERRRLQAELASLPEAAAVSVTVTVTVTEKNVAELLIAAAYRSVAGLAVVPTQDVLGLGNAARMNTPGTAHGNWRWRLGATTLTPALAQRLRRRVEDCGRLPR